MEYQVTARKWRPQAFADVIGQENLIQVIKNALSSGKIPHAYLFSGARGVGKTTTARILAKSLNCTSLKNGEPCNVCPSCIEITNGYSLDVIEIDGASNRGIDNMRQIKDNVTYMAMSSKYKIYIIDEVHMITKEASNALLKTLEEPPEHVIFILATTESHMVLPTIRSRCQHYIFKKIPVRTIMKQLSDIAQAEGIKADEDGLFLIANAADGSMRDSQSIFDQVVLYSSNNITEETAAAVIGLPEMTYYIETIEAVKCGDFISVIRTIKKYQDNIGDIKLLTKGLIGFFRQGLLVKRLKSDDDLLDLTETRYKQIKDLFQTFSIEDISKIIGLLIDMFKDLKGDSNEKFLLEITLFKMMDYKNLITLADLRNEINTYLSSTNAPAQNFKQNLIPENKIAEKETTKTNTSGTMQYQKLSANTEQKPIITNDEINNSQQDLDLKTALQKVMNSHIIMKTMTSQIQNIEIVNDGLRVEMKNAHSCEYLNQNKKDIEIALQKISGKTLQTSFLFHKTECKTDQTQSHQINDITEQGPVSKIEKQTAPIDPKKKLEELKKQSLEKNADVKTQGKTSTTVDNIVNLFEGKKN